MGGIDGGGNQKMKTEKDREPETDPEYIGWLSCSQRCTVSLWKGTRNSERFIRFLFITRNEWHRIRNRLHRHAGPGVIYQVWFEHGGPPK